MNIEKILSLGERVDLHIERTYYRTNVQDFVDEQTFLISHPTDEKGVPIYMENGDAFNVIYLRDNSQYAIRVTVEGRARTAGVALLRLRAKADPERFYRRNGYRLNCDIPVKMRALDSSGGLKGIYNVHTVDISEGGMQVLMGMEVPLGAVFDIEFDLDDSKKEPVSMRVVVRRFMPPLGSVEMWRIGLEYMNCTEALRRRISRFILREQAMRRSDRSMRER